MSSAALCVCNDAGTRFPCDIDTNLGCTECRKLSAFDTEIAEIRTRLSGIVKQRQEHFNSLNLKHDKLTRRLPLEICSMIFILSTEKEGQEHFPRRRPKQRTTSFSLQSISKTWRNIALSTPQLWTSLSIKLNDYSTIEEGERIMCKILARSGTLPLSLAILYDNVPDIIPVKPVSRFYPIHDILCSHSRRWQTVELHASEETLKYILQQCPNSSPRKLSIHCGTLQSRQQQTNFRGRYSSPFQVRLSGLAFDRIPIDWVNVTHLETSSWTWTLQDYYEVIKHAPQLECIDLCDLSEPGRNLPNQVLTHHNLRRLNITVDAESDDDDDSSPFDELFDRLLLPALSTIVLEIGDQSRINLRGLVSFIQRSGSKILNLTFLRLGDLEDPDPNDVITFLGQMPGLETLVIGLDSFPLVIIFLEKFLATARLGGPTSAFLPQLQNLEIRFEDGFFDDVDVGALLPPEVPLTRHVAYRPLSALTLCTKSPASKLTPLLQGTIQRIQKAQDQGFKVQMRSGTLYPRPGSTGDDFIQYCVELYKKHS